MYNPSVQKRATAKYMQDKHVIRVVVPSETADRYKSIAKERGFSSLNQFVIDCVENQIKEDEK